RLDLNRPESTATGLAALIAAQQKSIAFENIDPLRGQLPDLSTEALWSKLVAGGRGGYCFELNGLLGDAMTALGFDFKPVLARVRMGSEEVGPRTHLAMVVTIGGER